MGSKLSMCCVGEMHYLVLLREGIHLLLRPARKAQQKAEQSQPAKRVVQTVGQIQPPRHPVLQPMLPLMPLAQCSQYRQKYHLKIALWP